MLPQKVAPYRTLSACEPAMAASMAVAKTARKIIIKMDARIGLLPLIRFKSLKGEVGKLI